MRTILTTLHSKYIHPSLALPCLAAFCQEDGGDIGIREFTVHEPKENVLADLLAEEPDVVAFSVYLWNRRQTLDLLDALAVARPGLRLVIGGPEVSFDGPELFGRHPGITALVRGEGELPLRALLGAWNRGEEPDAIPRLVLRREGRVTEGPDGPPLDPLDVLPSPFAAGGVDTSRGQVYLETSRGCPYSCSFCMSALDERVRSFSPGRIEQDLAWLMGREIDRVKLVDRTFNFDPARARRIWSFILEHNRNTRFHFEIGAHLLEEACLELLETVPEGMFQFEIGVQSTLPSTLHAIGRRTSLERLEKNVLRLRRIGNIHLHLDLIAGLPGEDYRHFLASIERVAALGPHHLQIEPVKLLPGSPLRKEAGRQGIRFDPNPPYAVLSTSELSFADLERLRGISRLFDLTCNSGCFGGFLESLTTACGGLANGLERLEKFWRERGLFRHPLARRALFENIWDFIRTNFAGETREVLRERLGRDFAASERIVPGKAPSFLDTDLFPVQAEAVRRRVREETEAIRGQGIRLQYFAARFERLPDLSKPCVLLFLYLTRTGAGMKVRQIAVE